MREELHGFTIARRDAMAEYSIMSSVQTKHNLAGTFDAIGVRTWLCYHPIIS